MIWLIRYIRASLSGQLLGCSSTCGMVPDNLIIRLTRSNSNLWGIGDPRVHRGTGELGGSHGRFHHHAHHLRSRNGRGLRHLVRRLLRDLLRHPQGGRDRNADRSRAQPCLPQRAAPHPVAPGPLGIGRAAAATGDRVTILRFPRRVSAAPA